ncbi:MFS transporter [Raoultibacter timonensis]|uniref:MFS transporter n=1 Tax=Raoultibacter timonensis TaxID=1907662 RepID=A0ABM7WIS1_9ACTN|nr:MFS transporter [Raoultibacter timonensis]BDE96185.1 MFS transporter [Raoultibacter timonensis]BDF50790.1 MFS transporter [Raoultibacter timonensis]
MDTSEMHPERLWNRKYVHVLLMEIVMQMALYLTRPITASYAVSLGASVAAAGFVAGLLATAAVVVRPLSGSFSDLFSKKNLLVAAAALFAVSAFGCATATTTLMLGAWCAVQGFAFAFKSTLIISMASLVVPRESLGSGVGWLSIAYTVACALGPAIGSSLGGSFGYSVVYLLSACLLVVGFVLAVTFKAPAASSHHAPLLRGADVRSKMSLAVLFRPSTMFYGPAIAYSLVAGLMMVAQGTTNTFLVFMGERGEVQGAPLYFVVYSIVTLASKPLAGRISDRQGVAAVVVPALAVAAIGMVQLSLIRSALAVCVAAVCMAVGQASAYAALQAESVRKVNERKLGRAANTFYIGPDIGMGLGPVLGGFVLQTFGASATFAFNAAALLLSLLVFLAYRRRS